MSASGSSRGIDRERLMLELRRAARPSIWLVLLIVASLTAAGIILSNIGVGLPWSDTYKVRVEVDDAAGVVAKKQSVRLAGIDVGRIDAVDLEGGKAIVTLAIDGDRAPLYRDARLRLRPETPLNDLFINIEKRGTPAAGELGQDEILPAERTQVAVNVGKVLDVFNVDTRDRLEQTIDEAGAGLGDRGPQFRQSLVELTPFLRAARRITQETAERRTQTSRLIHNFRLMTEELGRRDVELRRLVKSGAASLGELGASEAAIRSLVDELPPTMRQLDTTFKKVRRAADELDPAFDEFRPVADALPEGLDELRRFSVQARPSIAQLRKPLPQLDTLLDALRPTARGLRSSFQALTPVPARLDRITRLIGPCERALDKFFANTISLGKFADANSVILRGQTVVGASSAGGLVNDDNQTAAPSCTPGGLG
ncbi:MAG: MCE family protein [Solirubrobacterales bacterium]|nr:MCE family protein [Solirubrobacterales bacterium]